MALHVLIRSLTDEVFESVRNYNIRLNHLHRVESGSKGGNSERTGKQDVRLPQLRIAGPQGVRSDARVDTMDVIDISEEW